MNAGKYFIIGIVLLLIAPLGGCSKGLSLREVTTKAIVATSEAQSYRASAVDTYTVDGETGESTYESEFVAPDRYRGKTSSNSSWHESIVIGDKGYIRSSDKPQWCQSPCQYDDYTSVVEVSSISLEKELEPLNWLVGLEQLPDEEIDGVDCWHYRGTVDMDSYVEKLKAKAEGKPPEYLVLVEEMRRWRQSFELWVGKDDYLIRQLKNEARYPVPEPGTGEEKWATRSTVERFYDFNEPIQIEPPPT